MAIPTQDIFQALIDKASQQWQAERAQKQMTLGKLIAALEALPAETPIDCLEDPHSYRGYYSDLALELHPGTRAAAALLNDCRSIMGRKLSGYKGGDYLMGEDTPVWVSLYGMASGLRLMAIAPLVTQPDDEDA